MHVGEQGKAHSCACLGGRWIHEVDACVLATFVVAADGHDGKSRLEWRVESIVTVVTVIVTVALRIREGYRWGRTRAWLRHVQDLEQAGGRVKVGEGRHVKDTARRPGWRDLPRTVGAAYCPRRPLLHSAFLSSHFAPCSSFFPRAAAVTGLGGEWEHGHGQHLWILCAYS